MKRLTLPTAFLLILLTSGCDQPGKQAKSKRTAAQKLENYFQNESTLRQTAWSFYATQTKESGLYAYLIFPEHREGVTRSAPVESELRRLCPDRNFNNFWNDTGLDTIELVLIKNPQPTKGKAQRLLQITCDSSFDLLAFETSTSSASLPKEIKEISQPKISTATTMPAYPFREELPDAAIAFYPIETDINESYPLETTSYEFPAEELENIHTIIEDCSSKEISTNKMKEYYPAFVYWIDRIPYFGKASTVPPDTDQYSTFYYQKGSIRAHAETEGNTEKIVNTIFYNEYGAPVVAIERSGYNNDRIDYSVIEYDKRGYLSRVSHFSNNHSGLHKVSIYQVEENYHNTKKYTFLKKDGKFILATRQTYTKNGTLIWNSRTKTEKKHNMFTLEDELNFHGKYPLLAPVIPIPE